jgi:hypothetical protein
VLNSKGDWEVLRGAKAKRKEVEAAAIVEAQAKEQAAQRDSMLAAMTASERKLFLLREEDAEDFDADEKGQELQEREAKAQARLARHEKRIAKKNEKSAKPK